MFNLTFMSKALPPTAVNTQSPEQRPIVGVGVGGVLGSSPLPHFPSFLLFLPSGLGREVYVPLFLPLSAEALLFLATSPEATGVQSILYDRAMGFWMWGVPPSHYKFLSHPTSP